MTYASKYSKIALYFLKMLRCASSTIIRSKCDWLNSLLPSSFLIWSIAFNIVGYVENTILAFLSSLLDNKLHSDISGKYFLKSSFACSTNAILSAKNNVFVTYLPLDKTSVRLAAVRVFPVPVAMTRRERICPSSIFSQTARTACFW